eukprot:scaffold4998_cov81-Skeletonema_menzelii.AAC.2
MKRPEKSLSFPWSDLKDKGKIVLRAVKNVINTNVVHEENDDEEEDEDDVSAGFAQMCSSCEKQMLATAVRNMLYEEDREDEQL